MGILLLFPPFAADGRGNKLTKYEICDDDDSGSELKLCGPDEVAAQIIAVAGDTCVDRQLDDKGRLKWTHALHFPEGVPQEIEDLCEILTNWLSIPNRADLDLSLSLDWYKQPDDEGELVHTPTGELIYRTKYAKEPTWSSSRQARRELLNAMVRAVDTHPMLAAADVISTPPGSNGDGTSFGEILGREIAERAGRPFVPMSGPPRAQQKEEVAREVRNDFSLTEVVRGPLLLIDDVFHTGVTMESAARAARRAGASHVFALTAARTLRR
ncbi:hypothetical protein [Agromyces atrinae]|uniref:Adenine/guanine phosphoribosyltransferase-like PRPP-binding protein n=1 Tax=Agromyces atrinae TaxID=592376 RepID=A0A4Q2M7D1_9MICO|nr:hypothetical protein [Agromyces atrinae]NYD67881.1 adenine/guanine phosphoribosyltransferase-like PRPP-binding protein [Agromyces atrinae]RXZ87949.1 hypothetical protein ESP50_01770 [Agromyces atrinae]